LQLRLQDQNFFPYWIKPTGYFGEITLSSLKVFQKFYDLVPTGQVGSKEREVLSSF